MTSILITGNRGFIGSGLEGDGIDIKDGIDIVTYKAKKQYDIVIHTAAKTSVKESIIKPEIYERTNVNGTLNLIRQHPKAHFIYLSTAAVYGEGEKHTVDSQLKPESPYASTKLSGEYLVRSIAKSWVILRLTNVIGEGEREIPNVYQVFAKQDEITVYGDGLQTRDFVSVDFVRKVIVDSYNRSGIFNVGSGVSKRIIDIAKEFKKPIKFLPAVKGEITKFGIDPNAINNITEP